MAELNDKLINYGNLATFQNNLINDSSTSDKATWSSEKIAEEIQQGGGAQPDLMVNVTYSQLKNLRDNSQLVKGQKYRITDYVTTTALDSTKSANHQFDIIVTADDVNKLNENAKAINHNFSGQTVTYHKWMYDITGEAWILSNEDSYTNEVSGTCPLEDTPMYGMEYYTNVYPIEGVIGIDDEVPYTPNINRKAVLYTDGNTIYVGDYIDEEKWNSWVENGVVEGDYPEWFIGKYFLDGADTFSYDGTYIEGEDYFHKDGETLYRWFAEEYKSEHGGTYIYSEERNYSNSVAGTCEISGGFEGLEYYTVGYPIAGVEYVDGETGAYLNDEKRILYTEGEKLVFGDSPYNSLLEDYNQETAEGEEHKYTLEQIEWFNGKYFKDTIDTDFLNATYNGMISDAVDAKLDSWELKYCLDNDTTRFNWADEVNGKGVIYYLKDEFNNECNYDFKNILKHRDKMIAFAWEYDIWYAIRVPEMDGTNTSTDEYNNYQYAWKFLKFGGGEGATVTIPNDGYCDEGYTYNYCPLTNIPSMETETEVSYFPKDEFEQFDTFLYQGDDCEAQIRILDTLNGGDYYTFGNNQDDTLLGGSNNNVIVSDFENGTIILPNDIHPDGVQYNQNFMVAGDNIKIENNTINAILPKATNNDFGIVKLQTPFYLNNNGTLAISYANTSRAGVVKSGNGLDMNTNTGVLSLKTASASQLGGVKVGSGLAISNGVLSCNYNYTLPTASSSTLGGVKVGNGLSIDENSKLSVTLNNNIIENTDTLYNFRNIELENGLKEYLTYEAAEDDCKIYFGDKDSDGRYNHHIPIEVSSDGENWTEYTSSYYSDNLHISSEAQGTLIATLNTGDKIYLRGNNLRYNLTTSGSYSDVKYDIIRSTKKCYVYGNLMSLVQKENFDRISAITTNVFERFNSTVYVTSGAVNKLYNHPTKKLYISANSLENSNAFRYLFSGTNISKISLVFNEIKDYNAFRSALNSTTDVDIYLTMNADSLRGALNRYGDYVGNINFIHNETLDKKFVDIDDDIQDVVNEKANKVDFVIPVNMQTQVTDWTVLNNTAEGIYRVKVVADMTGTSVTMLEGWATVTNSMGTIAQTLVLTQMIPNSQGSPLTIHNRVSANGGTTWSDYEFNLGVINDNNSSSESTYSSSKIDSLISALEARLTAIGG